MTFAQAQAYLDATIGEAYSPRVAYTLDRLRELLRRLGDPHRAYPTLHVGGTSGKGSTATMLASVLSASGRRTGLHVKPHLQHVTERARIDGVPVDEERFAALLEEMLPSIEAIVATHGRATYYETTLALAFLYFARERVDVAVIEVGLGGRLDGTNLLLPQVAAITSVGFDHTEILGDTLAAIAREKAGIAKPGVPLVTPVVEMEALASIEQVADAVGAPVLRVGEHARVEVEREAAFAQELRVVTERGEYHVRLPLVGAFQRSNAATAIVALEALPATLRPSIEAVERGLSSVRIAGRMEIVPGAPPVIFDIAHNPEKAAHVARAVAERFRGRRVHAVVAIGSSKDAREILRALAALPASFTFTRFLTRGRVAIDPAQLAALGAELGIVGPAIGDPREALLAARRVASDDDVLLVTGSTFVVGELREWWMREVASVVDG